MKVRQSRHNNRGRLIRSQKRGLQSRYRSLCGDVTVISPTRPMVLTFPCSNASCGVCADQ